MDWGTAFNDILTAATEVAVAREETKQAEAFATEEVTTRENAEQVDLKPAVQSPQTSTVAGFGVPDQYQKPLLIGGGVLLLLLLYKAVK